MRQTFHPTAAVPCARLLPVVVHDLVLLCDSKPVFQAQLSFGETYIVKKIEREKFVLLPYKSTSFYVLCNFEDFCNVKTAVTCQFRSSKYWTNCFFNTNVILAQQDRVQIVK